MITIPGYNARNPWVDRNGNLTVMAQAWLAGLVGAVRECQVAAEAGAVNRADVQAVTDAVASLAVTKASVPFVV